MTKHLIFITQLLFCTIGLMAQKEQQKEVSPADFSKMFVTKLSQKVELTKNQKDSVTLVYTWFIENIQKYRAENNARVVTYMTDSRDEKVKNILHDDKKYDRYLLFLEDMKKQRPPQQPPPQQQQGGQHNPMGNGQGL